MNMKFQIITFALSSLLSYRPVRCTSVQVLFFYQILLKQNSSQAAFAHSFPHSFQIILSFWLFLWAISFSWLWVISSFTSCLDIVLCCTTLSNVHSVSSRKFSGKCTETALNSTVK